MKKDLAVFEGHNIRRLYDEKTETRFFSVVDIIQVLTDQPSYQLARNYWSVPSPKAESIKLRKGFVLKRYLMPDDTKIFGLKTVRDWKRWRGELYQDAKPHIENGELTWEFGRQPLEVALEWFVKRMLVNWNARSVKDSVYRVKKAKL